MREALGITIDQSPEEAIKTFWVIGDYLQKGKPKSIKVDKAFKKINKLYEYLEN